MAASLSELTLKYNLNRVSWFRRMKA